MELTALWDLEALIDNISSIKRFSNHTDGLPVMWKDWVNDSDKWAVENETETGLLRGAGFKEEGENMVNEPPLNA